MKKGTQAERNKAEAAKAAQAGASIGNQNPGASQGNPKRGQASSPPPPHSKRAREGDPVPVQALGDSAATQAEVASAANASPLLCRPAIDNGEKADVALNVAKMLPYVKSRLREWLQSDKDLSAQFKDQPVHMHPPWRSRRRSQWR